MGIRTGVEDWNQLHAASRLAFLNGIIKGEPIANNVVNILHLAAAFGGDEADRKSSFSMAVDCDTFDELKLLAVEEVVSRMFNGSVSGAIHHVVMMGAAFGFKMTKLHTANLEARYGKNEVAQGDAA